MSKNSLKFLWLILLVVGISGCVKRMASSPKLQLPRVYVVDGSDPVPDELRKHIIKRTDQFCRETGRAGVEEIAIRHNATERATQVVYICINDPKDIEDIRDSSVPFKINVDLRESIVTYYSSKAVVCLFTEPNCDQ